MNLTSWNYDVGHTERASETRTWLRDLRMFSNEIYDFVRSRTNVDHIAIAVLSRPPLEHLESRWIFQIERFVQENHRRTRMKGPIAIVSRILEYFLKCSGRSRSKDYPPRSNGEKAVFANAV